MPASRTRQEHTFSAHFTRKCHFVFNENVIFSRFYIQGSFFVHCDKNACRVNTLNPIIHVADVCARVSSHCTVHLKAGQGAGADFLLVIFVPGDLHHLVLAVVSTLQPQPLTLHQFPEQ